MVNIKGVEQPVVIELVTRNEAWEYGELKKAMERASVLFGEAAFRSMYEQQPVAEPRGMIFKDADFNEIAQIEDKNK